MVQALLDVDRMRLALVLLCACELADPMEPAPSLVMPDAVEVEAIRTASPVNDPPPPKPAIAPDLVGLRAPLKHWFLALSPVERHEVRGACRARKLNPCWQMRDLGAPEGRSTFHALDEADDDNVDEFCRRTTRMRGCMTPLVLADEAPIGFLPATRPFAFGATPVATDWPTAPWLALDRDGDGAITSGAELFGDATGAANGFEALATLDANRDGTIDRDDPAFASLLLWADANGDRESSPDELRLLANEVVAIPLAYHVAVRCTRGNCERERTTVQLRDGRTGAVVDVYLAER